MVARVEAQKALARQGAAQSEALFQALLHRSFQGGLAEARPAKASATKADGQLRLGL